MSQGVLTNIPSGHVFRVERKRGPCWYMKYRLSDGRQIQNKLRLAWAERGRPPAGYYTSAWPKLSYAKRSMRPVAERWRERFAPA
jgi:hypothetical protein